MRRLEVIGGGFVLAAAGVAGKGFVDGIHGSTGGRNPDYNPDIRHEAGKNIPQYGAGHRPGTVVPAGVSPEADGEGSDVTALGDLVGKDGSVGTEELPFSFNPDWWPLYLLCAMVILGSIVRLSQQPHYA